MPYIATKLGYKVNASAEYARKMTDIYMRKQGLGDVIATVKNDLLTKGIKMNEHDLENCLNRCRDKVGQIGSHELE